MKNNPPGGVVWFTGLSASGKSTLARAVASELERRGIDFEYLDGDTVREFFDGDLGYSREEREKNIRRIAFAADCLSRHGIPVIVANIAPYDSIRKWIRARISRFALVYLDVSVETCRSRDRKGIYTASTPVVGRDEPYEIPEDAEIVIDGSSTPEQGCCQVIAWLLDQKWIF